MATYSVYYMKPDWITNGLLGSQPDAKNLEATHTLLEQLRMDVLPNKDIYNVLGHIFEWMQSEKWDFDRFNQTKIAKLGLNHTSMSVGDVIVDDSDGIAYLVAPVGFIPLGNEA